jgi:leader peptidase (prepilin peptidase) / N-methyltransferase
MINAFFLSSPIMAYLLLGLLSLLIGSVLNMIIYRLPIMIKTEWQTQCLMMLKHPIPSQTPINLFFPRSFCPNCKSLIRAYQNIPLLSYLCLRGRCSHCKHPISLRYPIIEGISLSLSLLAGVVFGFHLILVFALAFIWLTILLFAIDLEHQLLPDELTLSLLWLGLIANTQSLFTSLPNAVFSAAGAYLCLWLLIKVFYWITGKIGMGNGDFKLFAAFGAWFGWTQLPFILILASLSGAIIGLSYLTLTKQSHKTPIPFGPFLCVSGLITLFFGNTIITKYLLWLNLSV